MSEPVAAPPAESVEVPSEKKDEAEETEPADSNNQLEDKLEETAEAEAENEKNEKVAEEKKEELTLPLAGQEGETD